MLYAAALALESGMRISDRVLKCAVFLGTVEDKKFVPLGTAFLVQKLHDEHWFQYLVTAQHNVIQAGTRPLHVRVNRLSGKAEVLEEIPPDLWIHHPESSKRFVDVVAMSVTLPPDIYDIALIKDSDLWSRGKVEERDIGVGEELFYPGLFLHHSGEQKNLPVMRAGVLAAMPSEPVQTKRGPIEAYLMESRSIGGHSGSPVFANLLAHRTYYADKRITLPHPMDDQRYPVLGLLRSYFKASDEGLSTEDRTDDLSLNSGISTIIPAWEILATIDQEGQIEARKKGLEQYKKAKGAAETEASAAPKPDNPAHKEDFTHLLSAAAKTPPQDD
jgi:hypothetical protein